MKSVIGSLTVAEWPSLPARGAWVEIILSLKVIVTPPSLPARGAWVEIILDYRRKRPISGRSPHGERGLKFLIRAHCVHLAFVAPRTGSVG